MRKLRLLFPVVLLLLSSGSFAQVPGGLLNSDSGDSQTPAASVASDADATASPDQIRSLLQLLADEKVARWLQTELEDSKQDIAVRTDETLRTVATRRLQQIRSRAQQVMAAISALPVLPGKLQSRWQSGMTAEDSLRSIIYLLIFLFIGFGLEWLYWCYASLKLHQLELSNVAGLKASAKRAGTVGLLRLGGATIFSLGCVGTFLFFEWSELASQVVLGVLVVAVVLRVLLVLSRVIFAPASEHLRMVPLSTPMAKRCVRWIFIIAAVALVSRMTADTFVQLGIDQSGRISVYFLASAAMAIVFIIAVWVWFARSRRSQQLGDSAGNTSAGNTTTGYALSSTATSPYLVPIALTVLTLIVLTLDTLAMHQIKWLLLMCALLLPAIAICRHLVDYYFDRALTEVGESQVLPDDTRVDTGSAADPDAVHLVSEPGTAVISAEVAADVVAVTQEQAATAPVPVAAAAEATGPEVSQGLGDNPVEDAEDQSDSLPFNMYRPVMQRLARIAVIVFAVLTLFAIVDMPLWMVYQSDGVLGRIVQAIIDVAAVLLLADLLWVWTKTLIDRRLSEFEAPAHGQLPGPGARMATLLPLFRKVIFAVIAVMVVLVLLSSFGVNIAPLLAGAGVIGIAVGFGAQALVKDVVSGVFFLLEDAFRVGEYIEMGDLRGTVESISLRSLRVRHHLGAVHTIPYGELSSLTNHSRDWAIIKMEFRVPFDTDIKLVKKIVKKIGAELQKNEVYGHHIIEPLKSQGVRRMEEFNMVVGVKFMSEPGQQWTIRRDAYQAIRDAFDQNGLSFAERSVKVEVVGDGTVSRDAIAGAAQDAIDEQMPGAPKVVDDTP